MRKLKREKTKTNIFILFEQVSGFDMQHISGFVFIETRRPGVVSGVNCEWAAKQELRHEMVSGYPGLETAPD